MRSRRDTWRPKTHSRCARTLRATRRSWIAFQPAAGVSRRTWPEQLSSSARPPAITCTDIFWLWMEAGSAADHDTEHSTQVRVPLGPGEPGRSYAAARSRRQTYLDYPQL